FESLFLRKEKPETRVSGFLFPKNAKSSLLSIFWEQKANAFAKGIRVLLCPGFPSGITAGNPFNNELKFVYLKPTRIPLRAHRS
ncbi:MAG: hypothetical protein ACOVOQ_15670, partial [Flavobacterium sp.]